MKRTVNVKVGDFVLVPQADCFGNARDRMTAGEVKAVCSGMLSVVTPRGRIFPKSETVTVATGRMKAEIKEALAESSI